MYSTIVVIRIMVIREVFLDGMHAIILPVLVYYTNTDTTIIL